MVKTPGVGSATFMLNVHVLALLLASTARQVTVLTPSGKNEPEGGVQAAVTFGEQLSVAPTEKNTCAPLALLQATVLFVGQMMAGFSVSFTVTVKLRLLLLPAVSIAVQVTVVTPLLKVVPEGGLHVAVTPGQLSLAVTA